MIELKRPLVKNFHLLVMSELQKNIELWKEYDSSIGLDSLGKCASLKTKCKNDCSGRGICNNGKCTCNDNWSEDDCSQCKGCFGSKTFDKNRKGLDCKSESCGGTGHGTCKTTPATKTTLATKTCTCEAKTGWDITTNCNKCKTEKGWVLGDDNKCNTCDATQLYGKSDDGKECKKCSGHGKVSTSADDSKTETCNCDVGYSGAVCQPTPAATSTSSSISGGAIAGIVIAVLLVLIGVGVGGWFLYKHWKPDEL